MNIRLSTAAEAPVLQVLHREAFGEAEGDTIAQLVGEMLTDETARPLLSLVAEQDGQLLGHVLFTAVKIDDAEHDGGYIMAPLAVVSAVQSEGVGTALIKEGLTRLKASGGRFVLVLGDPAYYSKTGFKAAHNIQPPHPLEYPEAWMAQELEEGAIEKVSGMAHCAVSLSDPKHW